MERVVATLVASLALLSLTAPAAAQRRDGTAPAPPLIDVPYVSQGELLCGGAAAAMLVRAAGARRVYAEDFKSLVDATAGGIRTKDLAHALESRGYVVQVFAGTPAIAQQFLAARRPVLSLIQDRPGRYHYVVLVGWYSGLVTFHDPARAPFLNRAEGEFDRAWAAAKRWMLVLDGQENSTNVPSKSSGASADANNPARTSAVRDAATARFLDRDYAEAARLSSQALASNPGDLESWRLLGASRYLTGDPGGALDAWNQSGDPTLDLVRLEGLSRTPHRAVERLLGLRAGAMLTRSNLVRADRRLALLPAGAASRVSYVALPGNLAEVRGAIVERPLHPSRLEWVATAARVAIDRELVVALANLASSGDRLTAGWRFWEGRPAANVAFAFPTPRFGGVGGLSLGWQQERYEVVPASTKREAMVRWNNWMTSRLRVSAGVGGADWIGRGRTALFGGGIEFRPVSDQVAIEFRSRAAGGTGGGFATTDGLVRWRRHLGSFTVFGDHAVAYASPDAPPDQWPGAGTGIARPFLLRAHPLIRDGRITGAGFGRTLAQSSVELQREVARRAFAALGVAGFVDVARTWDRQDGSDSPVHVDVGAGVRIRLGPGQPAIRLDVAHGLRDGNTSVSAGWQLGWSSRS